MFNFFISSARASGDCIGQEQQPSQNDQNPKLGSVDELPRDRRGA
jgi:hypothetical protein